MSWDLVLFVGVVGLLVADLVALRRAFAARGESRPEGEMAVWDPEGD